MNYRFFKQDVLSNRRPGHVVYESSQFRAGIRAPAVGNIEYKKSADSGVLSQAVSYLSWLDSARHEFEALVKEKLGSEVAESIDWRNPRMVCIAAGFSHHDRVAVHRLRERIDLVRYRGC
ncbi:hypothetical protein [Streptomyces caniscabiei]|uniref:hypothetical protein n=1 Tax=Streptomyces caniscabiei TaxID=2746961 RepID=UPI0038F77531